MKLNHKLISDKKENLLVSRSESTNEMIEEGKMRSLVGISDKNDAKENSGN